MVSLKNAYELFLEKFPKYTEIQEKAFGAIEKGGNCILIAPTGSGKTEAAFLPVLDEASKNKSGGVYAIYITPLKSLNRDLLKRLDEICRKLNIRIQTRHGDTPQSERAKQNVNPPDILITTPESLQGLLLSRNIRPHLKNIRHVIVDELHELYYNKRGAQLSITLERLAELSGEFQRIGISATIGDKETAKRFLCAGRECRIVEAENKKSMDVRIEMPKKPVKEHAQLANSMGLDDESMARLERIAKLVEESEGTLIFTNTRQVAESLGSKLINFSNAGRNSKIAVHHSSLDKEERIRVENDFKDGKLKGIVATSSLELGIDIGNVNLVIQYGSPRQVTRLVQRVGRGGHAVGSTSVGKVIVANAIDVLESAAIIRKAAEKALEKHNIEENALDVLANQICAIAIEYRRIPIDKICAIVGRASPYQRLGKEDIVKIVKFLEQLHMLRFDGSEVMLSRRAMSYFFNNISVIPDTRKIAVKNFVDNKRISVLDEAFVSNYIDEESTFITKGLPWKVVSIEEDTVTVEPAFDQEAAIPDWEGEDIPVSYEVSKEVYEMLGSYNADMFARIADQNAAEAAEKLITDQKKAYSIKEGVLFVEDLEDYIILNTPMGKLANEFLAKAMGSVAMLMSQSRISAKATPYSVVIDVSGVVKKIDPRKLIAAFSEYSMETLLKNFVVNSELFRYKFVQVAKLFGVIEKKAVVTKSAASRLIEFYKDSAVYEETLRDLKKNYFDIAVVDAFRERLHNGGIKVEVVSEESPLSEQILRASYRYRELIEKLAPKSSEIDEFAKAILGKGIDLICTYCGFRFGVEIGKVGDAEKILCPACGSPMVGTYDESYENVVEKRRLGKQMSSREKAMLGEMLRSASLVDSYGRRALIALATYGIGLETAARILKMLRKDFNIFVIDLINAQRTFIKNKRFWAR